MIIYITTNLVNGKKYIGQDLRNNPTYLGSGLQLKKAIKKYGRQFFKKDILCYADSAEVLNELEKYYIEYYSAQTSSMFYNISQGGTGGIIWEKDKCQRCIPIYELDIERKLVAREFPSARHAAKEYNISFKNISAVIKKIKKSVQGRVFVSNKENIDWNFYTIKDSRASYTVVETGNIYHTKKELYNKEFSHYGTYNGFIQIPLTKLIKEGKVIVSKPTYAINQKSKKKLEERI